MSARPYVVPALKKHTATVIMAHGLGDSGAGWMALAQNWRRRGKFEEVTFIFPNAPNIPITVNMGMKMPGWYDIAKLGGDLNVEDVIRNQDEPGILRSREYFNGLVKEQMDKGIKPSRIVLGGFSQGGVMAVFTGLTSKEKLGGIFGMSCYLTLSDRIKNYVPEDWPNKDTPVWLAHGEDDEVVKFPLGQMSHKMMKELGVQNVSFKSYPDLGHSADPQEIVDLEKFLEETLPSEGDGSASAGL
ncbi:acyl-protein thioesterase 1 [Penicillium chermesinum]|uniref:Acyl-protein thioesterase 1 n=1 Tax=Penicillium chermesinum TaxID=63820 RepID=A0A9W9PKK3_9EURO|nr:acyl-protein thioesterase 1 [Penicillium chermesinum]KAJ5249135.1 acyl-protein thioesterase 1 [Penicillium chermesinum]KAJ6151233.1 acyl-protein thioesterase 1 [Penicillium chermesinum]